MDMLLNALEQVNPLAVGAATVATFLFGWLWHSPVLFMKQWMEVNNLPDVAPDPKEMMTCMGYGVLNTVLINTLLATLLILAGTQTLQESLVVGVVAWAAFSLYEGLGMMIWEGKPFTALWVKAGHTLSVVLIGIMVMSLL